jgi:hypothetical protein
VSTQQDASRSYPPWWIIGRDMLFVASGLYFAYRELGRPEDVRNGALLFVGAMLGLPAVLHGGPPLWQALVQSIGSGRAGSSESPASADPPPPPSVSS